MTLAILALVTLIPVAWLLAQSVRWHRKAARYGAKSEGLLAGRERVTYSDSDFLDGMERWCHVRSVAYAGLALAALLGGALVAWMLEGLS